MLEKIRRCIVNLLLTESAQKLLENAVSEKAEPEKKAIFHKITPYSPYNVPVYRRYMDKPRWGEVS